MESKDVDMKVLCNDRTNIHISYTEPVQPYHKKIAELVVKHTGKTPITLLDIGCGVGHTLSEIKKRKQDAIFFVADIDENTLALTKEKVQVAKCFHINLIEDLFDLKLKYDVVILSHVIEHTSNPLDIVKGVVNLLSPNGILVLAVPNPVRLTVIVHNIFKKHYVNRGHIYAWDRSHWINFLNISGVNVVEYSQDYFQLPLLTKFSFVRPLEIFLAKIFPWFAFSNIAVIKSRVERVNN